MRAGAIGRQLAGKSNWSRLAGASLAVLALPGCVAMQQQRLAPGEAPVLQGPAVTVAFACEFLDAAYEGDLIEADGEVTRAGGSLIFVRGLLKSGDRALFSFSGTIKRVKKRV